MGLVSWYRKASAPPEVPNYTDEEVREKFAEYYLTSYDSPTYNIVFAQFWDSWDKPPAYRRYLNKLDACVMSYFFLSLFIKTLDNINVNNAYISGMRETLHLDGQQRNLFHTFQYIGIIVGSIPGQAIMHNRIRPAIWVPMCEILWSIVVMCIALVKNARTIYGLRFLIGLLEASNYPAIAQILGAWYRPEEIAKRMAVYDLSTAVGTMCSGFIQSGVYATLNGRGGIEAWRWLFIIDGVVSIPIAMLGFYCLPDYPQTTRALWLTEKEKEFSVIRAKEMGKKPKKKMTFKEFLGFFKKWRLYAFCWPYVLFSINVTYSFIGLWLKSLGVYSVEELNLIPCAGYGAAIIITYILANISDKTGKRAPMLLVSIFIGFLGNLLLQIWEIPIALKFLAQYFLEIAYPAWAIILTWSAESFQDDPALCGQLTAIGNTLSNAILAWLPLLAFPTPEAPRYRWGYGLMAGLNVLSALGVFFFVYMERRENRKLGRVKNKYGLAVDPKDVKDYNASSGRSIELAPAQVPVGENRGESEVENSDKIASIGR
ncbi:major facilitator superfamily domain-containing protein [Dipodascopsis tothii]|uniref:major facilitator superfamily domain-containing protein n=1 Tax=Dipodascopsis tothii TaxID=44089 RepID=UPI0034CF35F0